MRAFRVWSLILLLGLMAGCGYKPSAHYIKNLFDDDIYVEVKVSSKEPENATYLKDDLHRMIIRRFKGNVTDKANARNRITASYNATRFDPSGYDKNGYVTRYKVTVVINFTLVTSKGVIRKTISAYKEQDISGSSQFISAVRVEAIRGGMERALDEFLSYVSAQGALNAAQ